MSFFLIPTKRCLHSLTLLEMVVIFVINRSAHTSNEIPDELWEKGKSMFQEVNLKIIGKWVQRVEIRLVSTFDQKIIVFEELKKIFIK